jgi:hypothetical protein
LISIAGRTSNCGVTISRGVPLGKLIATDPEIHDDRKGLRRTISICEDSPDTSIRLGRREEPPRWRPRCEWNRFKDGCIINRFCPDRCTFPSKMMSPTMADLALNGNGVEDQNEE